jgi:hypothetical protein
MVAASNMTCATGIPSYWHYDGRCKQGKIFNVVHRSYLNVHRTKYFCSKRSRWRHKSCTCQSRNASHAQHSKCTESPRHAIGREAQQVEIGDRSNLCQIWYRTNISYLFIYSDVFETLYMVVVSWQRIVSRPRDHPLPRQHAFTTEFFTIVLHRLLMYLIPWSLVWLQGISVGQAGTPQAPGVSCQILSERA